MHLPDKSKFENQRGGTAVPCRPGGNAGELFSLLGLSGGHFSLDFGGDVPNELEGSPGTQDEDAGNQHAQNLDTGEDGGSLDTAGSGDGGIVADPAQSQNGGGVTDGLADTAGQVEGAVDGRFRVFGL